MAQTTFVDKTTVIEADWLNDVDAHVYSPSHLTLDSTTPRTSLFTAEVGKWYLIDTSSGSFNITMPNSPSAESAIGLQDYTGTFAANPPDLIQAASGDNIFRANEDGKISINNFSGALVMTDSTNGWMNRGF